MIQKIMLKGLDEKFLRCMEGTLGTKPEHPGLGWEPADFEQAFLSCTAIIQRDDYARQVKWNPSTDIINQAKQLWKNMPMATPREYMHKMTTQTNQAWTQSDLDRECQMKYGSSWVWDSESQMCVDTALEPDNKSEKKRIIKLKF